MLFKILVFFPLIFLSFFVSAQNLYKVELDSFVYEQKQEKVYLHFDKPQYAVGDDIWFKAYVTNATTHLPTEVSWNLKVELINEEKEILDSLTLFVENGVTHGHFSLSRKLKSGSYCIRAYTEWMRNNDSDFFYRKQFEVVNPSSDNILDSLPEDIIPKRKIFVDFLPEGGDLIDGIPTKVAFKATNVNGRGLSVNGIIVSDKGSKVATIESNDLGYGLCFFKPNIDELYLAIIEGDTFNLPPVENTGAAMRINHSSESESIHIAVQSKNIDLKGGSLVIHRRGKFLYSQKCLNSNTMAIAIKKSDLETGVTHITFFDKNKIPLTERLIFPNPPVNEADIVITPNKDIYENRSAVTLGIFSESDTIHSASITINPQVESSYKKYGENIENYLLLSSDLKGKVESPASYFNGTEDSYKSLDLLMLTHGWSRFNWRSLLEDDFAPEYFPEKGLSIRGRASNYYNDKNLKAPWIGVTVPSIGLLDETFKINENGHFMISGLKLMDSTMIYLQAFREKKEKIKKYESAKIEIEYPEKHEISPILYDESDVNPDFVKKAKKLNQISAAFFLDDGYIELEEVVIEVSTKKIKEDELRERTLMYSEPSNRLILDSLPNTQWARSIFDLLQLVPGVTVTGSFPTQGAQIRGDVSFAASSVPLYVLDGIISQAEVISTIPAEDVEFIDVLKGANAIVYGSRGVGGVIAVYTKRGGTSYQDEFPTGLLSFTHTGYHKAKEFYSPQYDIEREEHVIPDFRTTLYWNPELAFEDNYAKTTFYTSDQTGNFVIRVEGMFTNGKPFFKESIINIE